MTLLLTKQGVNEMTKQTKMPYQIRLKDDRYQFDEAASALQKSIRRNMEYEACWWAYVIHSSGYFNYVWKRLMIIASEDVGNATPEAAQIVHALQQSYKTAISSTNREKNDSLQFVMQAVMYLCRADKSREVDSIVNLIRTNYEKGNFLEIPEMAVDIHTKRGRGVHGRWNQGSDEDNVERHKKWYDEWSKVVPDMGDRYLEPLKKLKGVK
jgi:replication-associated recombination protein RarA